MAVAFTGQNADITIRNFNFPDDYPAVYQLWSRSGPGIQLRRSDTEPEIGKKITRDPDLFLLAESKDQVIGCVLGGFDGRRGMVYHLAVDPAFRKMGIGTKLMRLLEERFREKGPWTLVMIRSLYQVTKFRTTTPSLSSRKKFSLGNIYSRYPISRFKGNDFPAPGSSSEKWRTIQSDWFRCQPGC